MLPEEIVKNFKQKISSSDHPRELAVEVLTALQKHYGYLSDEALTAGSRLLGLTLLELEELATFYDGLFRRPVGKYVIQVCDSVICWMFDHQSILDYLSRCLDIPPGGTTRDGLFSLLPAGCLGFCDRAPAMLINGRLYGPLTQAVIDEVLQELRKR
jgi:NADH-quinone oxidoreductase subunit E